jgi:hypothetical protein
MLNLKNSQQGIAIGPNGAQKINRLPESDNKLNYDNLSPDLKKKLEKYNGTIFDQIIKVNQRTARYELRDIPMNQLNTL